MNPLEGFKLVDSKTLPHISSHCNNLIVGSMNNQIETFHGKEMLRRVRLFEGTRIKISHRTTDLGFLKKCCDNKVVPCFSKVNHHLETKHQHAFIELSLSMLKYCNFEEYSICTFCGPRWSYRENQLYFFILRCF